MGYRDTRRHGAKGKGKKGMISIWVVNVVVSVSVKAGVEALRLRERKGRKNIRAISQKTNLRRKREGGGRRGLKTKAKCRLRKRDETKESQYH